MAAMKTKLDAVSAAEKTAKKAVAQSVSDHKDQIEKLKREARDAKKNATTALNKKMKDFEAANAVSNEYF
jgi:gas vesicle protein